MVSTKCPANVSGDEDCKIISEEVNLASQKKEQRARKQKVLTSAVWEHFDRIKSDTKEGTQKIEAICRYCHSKFSAASKDGTTHLKNHTQ